MLDYGEGVLSGSLFNRNSIYGELVSFDFNPELG